MPNIIFRQSFVSCKGKLLCSANATTCSLVSFSLKLEMYPKRVYGQVIPSDSEDSKLSGGDDDPGCKSVLVNCVLHGGMTEFFHQGVFIRTLLYRIVTAAPVMSTSAFLIFGYNAKTPRIVDPSAFKIQRHPVFTYAFQFVLPLILFPVSLSVSAADVEPYLEKLNDRTSELGACSDDDKGTANGIIPDRPAPAKRRIIWKANLTRDPETVQFTGHSELLEYIWEVETPSQYLKLRFPASLISLIADESNLFALQKDASQLLCTTTE